MERKKIGYVQLGKQGASANFLQTLENYFKTHENVKITVLKSARKDKEQVHTIADGIVKHLGNRFTCRIVGFTIIVKKWRKAVRE